MDVQAVAGCRRVQQRNEAGAQPLATGDLANDLAHDHGPVGPGQPEGRRDRDLELVRSELREEALGFDPRLQEGAHHRAGEGLRAPLGLEREGQCRLLLAQQLELMLEAARQLCAGLGSERCERARQEPPRAALPGCAVRFDDVAEQQLQRGLARARSHGRVGALVGPQAQIARRPERVWLGESPEGRQCQVGRDPADPFHQMLGELGGEDRAAPDDRAEVAGEECCELRRAHATASPVTVPLSQISSRRPIVRAPSRRRPASRSETTAMIPPAGLSRRSIAAARRPVG